jgi:hypothetical protein
MRLLERMTPSLVLQMGALLVPCFAWYYYCLGIYL